jgi:FAD/FMN-containing dehydrogenase
MATKGMSVLVFLSLLACSVRAQDVSAAAVGPAATTVPSTETDANVELFKAETVQLTEEVVAELSTSENDTIREYAHLFAFEGTGEPSSSRIRRAGTCKAAPGTPSWPLKIVWDIFDLLLGGALSPIVPAASPCYQNSVYNNYDAAKCAAVNSNWGKEAFHYSDPGSMMFPLYEGKTCMPKADPAAPGTCTQGGYSSYSIKVQNVAQIQLAVNFARLANLRLVIKNTGHDYNGRSTGKDALSLWMHNLKDIKFINNYVSPDYKGKAFKVGAGVQVREMYEAAEQNRVSVVGGICPTVGITGGYITGGGHSPLMQLFGMAADQVVALEVVTASGHFVTATPAVNSDLYWALLGGGGSTFGIVTSAVIKALPKVHVTTSTWTFAVSPTVSEDTFFEAVEFLWNMFPELNEAKTYSYFFISGITGSFTFSMDAFFAPNKTVAQFEALLAPFFAKLKALNIPYTTNTKFHNSFLPAYQATFEPLGQAIGNAGALPGNRIIPAENWNDATIRANSFAAVKQAAKSGLGLSVYHQRPANPAKIINSVNPAFRTEASMIIGISFPTTSDDQLAAAAKSLTNDVLGPLREVSPNGGTYYNEADINEPDWQQAFWGSNYPRLLSIKNKWDPTGLFYSHHGVGSEQWYVKDGVKFGGVPTQNGQLCRV